MTGSPDDPILSLERKRIGTADVASAAYDAKHGAIIVVLENGRIFRLTSPGDEGIPWWQWEWEEHHPVPGTQAEVLSRRTEEDEE